MDDKQVKSEEIRSWFSKKYDVDGERMQLREHSGNDVCNFIAEYLSNALTEDARGASELMRGLGTRKNEVIGTEPCPECESGNIGFQTPLEDDMKTHKAFIMCYDCGFKAEPLYLDEPLTIVESGKLETKPIIEKWEECA